MDYEDYEIDDYYKQKDVENEEMVDCGCIVTVAILIIGAGFAGYELVRWVVK